MEVKTKTIYRFIVNLLYPEWVVYVEIKVPGFPNVLYNVFIWYHINVKSSPICIRFINARNQKSIWYNDQNSICISLHKCLQELK